MGPLCVLLSLLLIVECQLPPPVLKTFLVAPPKPNEPSRVFHFFQIEIEKPQGQPSDLWMKIETTDGFDGTTTTTNWTQLDGNSKACFPAPLGGSTYSLRGALTTNPTPEDQPVNWSLPVITNCCNDWIRPKNQKTIILSGIVEDGISTIYDKVHITKDTILKASVRTHWEITFEETVTFTSDFYADQVSKIETNFPVFLENTTATILWFEAPRQRLDPRTLIYFLEARFASNTTVRSEFKAIVSNSSATDCTPSNIKQSWDTFRENQNSEFRLEFTTTCQHLCPEIFLKLDLIFYIGAPLCLILVIGTALILRYKYLNNHTMTFFKKLNTFWGTLFGGNIILGGILSGTLITLYYLRKEDGVCPVHDLDRYWGMWFAPTIFWFLAAVSLFCWLFQSYCVRCYPENVEYDYGNHKASSVATSFFGLLIPTVIFLWCSLAVPGYLSYFARINPTGTDGLFLLLWILITVCPLAVAFLLVLGLFILATCEVHCIATCFKTTHDYENLD